MKQIIIQYTVKEDQATINENLVKDVFRQLEARKPAGVHYQVYKTAERSFLHIVSYENETANNEFLELPAFKAFSAGAKDRIEAPVSRVEGEGVRQIGQY